MQSEEFIALAGKLAAQRSGAAGYRSAASRAYYGAYHLANVFLATLNFFCHDSNEHQWVQRHFQNCQNPKARTIGQALVNLHESRKDADYDLAEQYAETQANAKACVLRAEEIKRQLAECATDAVQIRAEMTEYRKLAGVQ